MTLMSVLYPGPGIAGHYPLLSSQEENDEWHCAESGGRHEELEVTGLFLVEVGQTHLKDSEFFRMSDHQ